MSKMPLSLNFYPRSPCGERPDDQTTTNTSTTFLSTLSLRRATSRHVQRLRVTPISIHALLAESDGAILGPFSGILGFLSTLSLRRATAGLVAKLAFLDLFLSTLSLRRATQAAVMFARLAIFLSTLSLRRATAKVHKTVGHFCAYETNFMEIASSC